MNEQFAKANKESFDSYMEDAINAEKKLENRQKKTLNTYEEVYRAYYGEEIRNPLKEQEDREYIKKLRETFIDEV